MAQHTVESVSKVLKEIQASIPKTLLEGITHQEKLTPTIEKVIDEALISPDISEEKKQQLQHLKDAGDFSKEKWREDPKRTKMVDNYVSRKINEAIRKGLLPPRSQIKNLLPKTND